jgi:hypothetical protein
MSRLASAFLLVALLGGVISTNGFHIAVSVLISSQPVGSATFESFRLSFEQPVGTVLLLAPHFVVGLIAYRIGRLSGLWLGQAYYAFGWLTLAALYWVGYSSAEHALMEEKWTAAALSIGLLPFQSVPLLLVLSIVGAAILWKTQPSEA